MLASQLRISGFEARPNEYMESEVSEFEKEHFESVSARR